MENTTKLNEVTCTKCNTNVYVLGDLDDPSSLIKCIECGDVFGSYGDLIEAHGALKNELRDELEKITSKIKGAKFTS